MSLIRNILFNLLLLALSDFASATLPDFIKTCKREQITINPCVRNSIDKMRQQLGVGIEELNIPSFEPFKLSELKITGIESSIKNLRAYGLTKSPVKHFNMDFDTNTIEVIVAPPSLRLDGEYYIDTQLLVVPFKGKGPLKANITNVEADAVLKFGVEQRDGQDYFKFTNCKIDIKIGDYDIELEGLFNGDNVLGEITNRFLNEKKGKQELLNILLPLLENTVCHLILETGNKIASSTPYATLLPPP